MNISMELTIQCQTGHGPEAREDDQSKQVCTFMDESHAVIVVNNSVFAFKMR